MRITPVSIAVTATLVLAPALAWADPETPEAPDGDTRSHHSWFVPGGHAALYAPANAGSPYLGGGFSVSLFQWSHDDEDFGPGRGRVYFEASLLRSAGSEKTMALYEGGVSLSFERRPNRAFLIPYYGLTSGGIVRDGVSDQGFIQPVVGIQVLAHRHVTVDVSGGYVFPFGDIDALHGVRAQASVQLHAW